MSMKIVTADERLQQSGIKGQIWGPAKIGKTSLLWTLEPLSTLFVNVEAGDLAVQGWSGKSIKPETWEECCDLALYISGPDKAVPPENRFSQTRYDLIKPVADSVFGDLSWLKTAFWDSTTATARMCLQWALGQPESFSERTGKRDTRGTYGLLAREVIAWANRLHHAPMINVWLVGGLDEILDDRSSKNYKPQMEGAKAANELPYIVDEIITMTALDDGQGGKYRAFICQQMNTWGYPAGDRSGRLDMIEQPHLGKLMAKIRGPAKPISERLEYDLSQPKEAKETKDAA